MIFSEGLRPASSDKLLIRVARISTVLFGLMAIGVALLIPKMGGIRQCCHQCCGSHGRSALSADHLVAFFTPSDGNVGDHGHAVELGS